MNVGFLGECQAAGIRRGPESCATTMQGPPRRATQALWPQPHPLAEAAPAREGPTWASSSCFLADFSSSLSSFSRRADSRASSRF